MAELQTTYGEALAKGYAGMVANGETSNRLTRTIEDAAGIAFGKGAFRGNGDHGITATAAANKFLGFTIGTMALAPIAGQAADTYPQYDNVPVMTQGAIFVNVTGAVTDGQALTIATATGNISGTAADATNIATGWVADETVTDGLCRIAKR